jgi:8-oxo-dGTP diphosphatase
MMAETSVVHVAAAAVFDGEGRVFITRRHEQAHQGGLWEFPGGKVEAGESVREALDRELEEEIGITVQQTRPLIRIRHDYPDKSVLLDVWRVDAFRGGAHGREGQPCQWVTPEQLSDYDFPAANGPIINAVRLPDRYLITPDPGADLPAFVTHLESRLRDGIRLLQLRAKSLSSDAYTDLARQCVELCRRYDTRLLLNADPAIVAEVGAQGVHLDSRRLNSLSARPFPATGPNAKWVSASCHSPQQLAQAEALGADFVVLSPVAVTASHPHIEPLGWHRFQQLADTMACPVFALGGMTPDDLEQAFAHGAQGVAAIRALWDSAEC